MTKLAGEFKDFLLMLQDRFKVPIRIDLAAFARMGHTTAVQYYDREIVLPVVRGPEGVIIGLAQRLN